MKLKNPFTNETRWLFHDARYQCWICGGNQNIELHHIAGRISSSPLNASPVCHSCHAQVGHSEEEEKLLFKRTLHYLTTHDYKINKKDHEFINSYQRLADVVYND